MTYDSKGNVLTRLTQNSTGSVFIKTETTYTSNKNYPLTQADARNKVVESDINPTTGTLTSVTDPNGRIIHPPTTA